MKYATLAELDHYADQQDYDHHMRRLAANLRIAAALCASFRAVWMVCDLWEHNVNPDNIVCSGVMYDASSKWWSPGCGKPWPA